MSGRLTEGRPGRWRLFFGPLLLAVAVSPVAEAGSYIFAGDANGADVITHPTGYTGSGGVIGVSVCIDPASVDASEMEIPVQNVIATLNGLSAATPNLFFAGDNDIPSGQFDFESVALHEVGHCIGLGHPNLGAQPGVSGTDTNFTQSTKGGDGAYDLGSGADGIIGSADDQRGDDINLHWFRRSNNNPFTLEAVIDATTYSRPVSDLPAGDSFAANGDMALGAALGFPDSEAVMQQGSRSDEDQRRLGHDDVATLRLGMSGLDELEGTADDYTFELSYAGLTTSCDVVLDFDAGETGFAVCQVGGFFISGTDHVSISSAEVFFNPNAVTWFFNQQPVDNGTIVVEKQTDRDGAAQQFAFSGDAAGTIGDGEQIVVAGLAPGTYTSTETEASGWDLTSIACDDADSSGNPATGTATFELQAGETVTCTFTNTELPSCSVAVDDLVVSDTTISGAEVFEACRTLTVGPNVTVTATGEVSLTAGEEVTFVDGVAILAGGGMAVTIAIP